jgi:hypothetical protein
MYRLGGLIVWNWTVYVCGANCIKLDCIILVGKLFGTGMYRCGKVQNMWNLTVYVWVVNYVDLHYICWGGKIVCNWTL